MKNRLLIKEGKQREREREREGEREMVLLILKGLLDQAQPDLALHLIVT